MFGRQEIPILEDKIKQLDTKIGKLRSHAKGLVNVAKQGREKIPGHFNSLLAANGSATLSLLASQSVQQFMSWESSQWEGWVPPVFDPDNPGEISKILPQTLRVGDLLEERTKGEFNVPAMMPFIGKNRTIIIATDATRYNDGLGVLQSLIVRTALMLPHQTTYTLIDPAGHGAAFPMRRHLSNVRENTGDTRRDLEQVIMDIQRINENYLDASFPSFELVKPEIRINERFQFVCAADFPNHYERATIEKLQSIANTGPRTGTYVFVHYNTSNPLPRDISMDEFRNAVYLDLTQQSTFGNLSLTLTPDNAPNAKRQELVFGKLKEAKPPERKVVWPQQVGLSEDQWWCDNATEIITTPIGARGASGNLNLWFGVNSEGQPCAHGMLGAMTGSGKSNLYHVLILGLAIRYSPRELRFFLIDGKDGVEFQPYRRLPHAEVVSLKSSPQLSRSVLTELVAERERRNKIFAECGVTDIVGYRRKGQPKGNLPRYLLLIDEYQELFDGDADGVASNMLLQLAQTGRSAGIHMLLGSQRFGAPGMLHQTAVFGNIHLRLAMQMTNSDVQALTEFGRRGKQLIATCDLPGKIVVNDRSGDDGANEMGKVAFLTDDKRAEVIEKLIIKADATLDPKDHPVTIVFDGKAQPNFIENQSVEFLMQQKERMSEEQFSQFAHRPVYEEGLGIADWIPQEHPKVMWLGQDFSVRGNAMMTFRRRISEHGIIVGGHNQSRYGMMGACIASLALTTAPSDIEFVIMDRSIPGTAWNATLRDVMETILKPNGYQCTFYKENRDAETMLDKLLEEMARRREIDEEQRIHEPSIYVFLADLHRVDDLRRRADSYGMSESLLGDKLQRLIIDGSTLGIHLIMTFEGVRPMTYVLDDRQVLVNFRHRVALQMSEDESLILVRSRRAAQLQAEGATPIVALYMDVENDQALRFKPYSIESTPVDYKEQMRKVAEKLQHWTQKL